MFSTKTFVFKIIQKEPVATRCPTSPAAAKVGSANCSLRERIIAQKFSMLMKNSTNIVVNQVIKITCMHPFNFVVYLKINTKELHILVRSNRNGK